MRSLLQPGTSSKTSPHRCKKLSPKSHPSQVLTLHLQYSPQAMQKPCQTFQFNIILNHISDITHQLSSITRPISYITHQNIIFQYHKDHIPGILRPSTSLFSSTLLANKQNCFVNQRRYNRSPPLYATTGLYPALDTGAVSPHRGWILQTSCQKNAYGRELHDVRVQ